MVPAASVPIRFPWTSVAEFDRRMPGPPLAEIRLAPSEKPCASVPRAAPIVLPVAFSTATPPAALVRMDSPSGVVPMKLPMTRLFVEPEEGRSRPNPLPGRLGLGMRRKPLPEITLWAARVVPPIVFPDENTRRPASSFPSLEVPSRSVPM